MSGIVGGNLGRGSGLIKAGAIDDNSVTLAKMAGLARGKLIYGDASGDPAALAVGAADEVLTHDGTDFDWAAAGGFDVSSITGATALAATPAATDELVLSDAGTLKRLDFSHIFCTPCFRCTSSGVTNTITNNTFTKMAFNRVDGDHAQNLSFDTGGTMDTSNYTWTPGTVGKYFFAASAFVYATDLAIPEFHIQVRKNDDSDNVEVLGANVSFYDTDYGNVCATGIINNDTADDHYSVYVFQDSGSNHFMSGTATKTYFSAFKIAGA
jgi:hypothetical protein